MRARRIVVGVWLGTLTTVLAMGFVPNAVSGATVPASGRTIWVDPVRGKDSRTGGTAATAVRSLSAAWEKIPASRTLQQSVTIKVRSGTIAASAAPNYWENRWGTATSPITIVSADGPGRARLPSVNMYNVRHLVLDGIAIRSPFDAFHCEKCSYIELRRSAFVGIGDPGAGQGPQESVKINQSDHLRIVDSYLVGATDNALDLVAVQQAYIARNTIAHAVDWCAYAKGGSSGIQFESNNVHHCGTGGITLGQGTGFQFMVAPRNNYEVYGASIINNVLHDIEGAALGVNGGFVTLLAHNTAYRTGTRDHLIEVVFGERSCDGTGEDDGLCAKARADGGWGPRAGGGDPVPIGNSQTAVVDNLLYNPAGTSSQWTQFAVYAPRPSGDSGGTDPAVADAGLIIRGNAIWNGTPDLALGLGGDQGCQDDHPTCAPELVRAANAVNTNEPPVRIAAGIVPVPAGPIDAGTGADQPLPTFTWNGVAAERGIAPVTMPAAVGRDRAGLVRADHAWQPGAYVEEAPLTTVTARITGRGRITTRAGGTVSGTGGSLTVLRGDWLELQARPATGQKVLSWSGACAGQRGSTCLVRATAASLAFTVRFG